MGANLSAVVGNQRLGSKLTRSSYARPGRPQGSAHGAGVGPRRQRRPTVGARSGVPPARPPGTARWAGDSRPRYVFAMEQAHPTCPRCFQIISADHSIVAQGVRLFHLDCDRPSALSFEECALLYTYCWNHAVADCVGCARSYRRVELEADLTRCPRCRADLTDRLRAHLYDCALLPANLRRRARETRELSRMLVKHNHQLRDAADVLLREVEVAPDWIRPSQRASS